MDRGGERAGLELARRGSAAADTALAACRPIRSPILRWGIGFLCVLPAAILLGAKWPSGETFPRSRPGLLLLSVCSSSSIISRYPTRPRPAASLALATLPLHTMVVGALLGIRTVDHAKIDRRRQPAVA